MKTTMTTQEALSVLQINERPATRDQIKAAYRLMAKRYHPDKNPNGLRLMQEVNVAYYYLSHLSDCEFSFEQGKLKESQRESDELDYLRSQGLLVLKKDHKTYVSGNTFHFREQLKELRFKWNPETKKWWRVSG